MHAITGITGKVGGAVARTLLSAGQRIRAVVRDVDKGRAWSELGCDVAIAEMEDPEALTRAVMDVTGVFIRPPTDDVGRVAAELLLQDWTGKRVVELEGPERVSQNAIAAELSKVLHRPVRAESVPREPWSAIFHAQGMRHPIPRIRMLDGFNEGWITFEGGRATRLKGKVTLAEVVQKLAG